MTRKKRIPIDQLLDYWVDISKRPTLSFEDYRLFFDRAKASAEYFAEFYGWRRPGDVDKFFQQIDFLLWQKDGYLKTVEGERIPNQEYALVKDVAKKFIPRIKKCFSQDIVAGIDARTPLQDAETILSNSAKLTYRWAAGIVASNHISTLLIQLSAFKSGDKYTDDIKTLYDNLKKQTKNQKLKKFLVTSYRRFEDADKTRNRCAHVNLGEPTKHEIDQSIATARLLQKFKIKAV